MATNPVPNPNENLVKVFDAEQASEVSVVRGLLESEGIQCEIRAIDITQDVMPVGGGVLLVREEDAARALQLIEDYRRTPDEALQEENSSELTEERPGEE
jgi:Putative prokaryotic signal transducing protein